MNESVESKDTIAGDSAWQRKLLPLMIRMVVGLTTFFFVATLVQFVYLHISIKDGPTINVMSEQLVPANASESQLEYYSAFLLESYAIDKRYHQGNVLLMSRVWTRYLGFATGMILAMVGAVFILGKLGDNGTSLDARQGALQFTLQSSSPGIVLAVLGVILMLVTIVTHHQITVSDQPLYLPGGVVEPETELVDP